MRIVLDVRLMYLPPFTDNFFLEKQTAEIKIVEGKIELTDIKWERVMPTNALK